MQNLAHFWQQLDQRPSWRWAKRGLYVLAFLAVFANFLANDKPLVGKHSGQLYIPVLREMAVDLGWASWPTDLTPWHQQQDKFEWCILPPIPYTPNAKDIYANFLSPFGQQPVNSWRYRHWLGTDEQGQDVLAQMIHGARTALLVGVLAITVALLIGLLLGSWAGFFGDRDRRISQAQWMGSLVGILLGFYYGFIARRYLLAIDQSGKYWLWALLIFIGGWWIGGWLGSYVFPKTWRQRYWAIPYDSIVMRIIEVKAAIPGLLFLLAILTSVGQKSVVLTALILGFLLWTIIARFVRGELLQIRSLGYIQAAKVTGMNPTRTLFRHALPNALHPVYTAAAFGIASAILAEASLSLLGLGLPDGTPSWGALLAESRASASAWWLAVFPGFAIFAAVSIFNFLGEAASEV